MNLSLPILFALLAFAVSFNPAISRAAADIVISDFEGADYGA